MVSIKNKIIKVPIIITFIIIIFGILALLSTNVITDELVTGEPVTKLLSVFAIVGFRLFIISATIALVLITWLVYAIFILIKKIRKGEIKLKNIIWILLILSGSVVMLKMINMVLTTT